MHMSVYTHADVCITIASLCIYKSKHCITIAHVYYTHNYTYV